MKRIEVSPSCGDCLSSDCPFWTKCACNFSAGDFRMESGFTPEIFVDTDDGTIWCKTATRPPLSIKYSELPHNYDELDAGFVNINEAVDSCRDEYRSGNS